MVDLVGEKLQIPERIYWDEHAFNNAVFNKTQQTIINCLFTRHHNGFVREKYLAKIIDSEAIWVIPFIARLIGSYVVEIITLIYDSFDKIHIENLRNFVLENPNFYQLTQQRVISYWNCYCRNPYQKQRKEDYVGFKLLTKIDDLITNT